MHQDLDYSSEITGMDEKAVARKVLVTLGDNNKNAHNPRNPRFVRHEKPKPLFNHCKFDVMSLSNRQTNTYNIFLL